MTDTATSAIARAAALTLWKGPVAPRLISGGITNINLLVEDAGQRYVVRVGEDLPVHQIMRFNERAATKAAHAAGISPEVVHTEPGIMVIRHIEGRTCLADDIRDPARLTQILPLLKRVHRELPRYFFGPALAFWPFHVIHNYAHTLSQAGSRYDSRLPDLVDVSASLELAVGPIDMVFGHNDLLPQNFIDDGSRLWLIDWDYAGFNSPLFDLANLASNARLRSRAGGLGALHLLRPGARRGAMAELPGDEMRVPAPRGDVEHGLGDLLEDRIRLRRLHARLHGSLRPRPSEIFPR